MKRPPPPGGRFLCLELTLAVLATSLVALRATSLYHLAALQLAQDERDGDGAMRLFDGLVFAVAAIAMALTTAPVRAQTGFDRPGGDYQRFVVPSGDPEVCATRCEHDGRCRAWTFSYPGTALIGGSNLATCWLKSQVKPPVENRCCASGVKGGALIEMRPGPVENAIDRIGGDYRNFDLQANQDENACRQACEGDNKCRAWSYTRPGYDTPGARCFLKDRITRPQRRPCCMSGVVR